MDNIKQNLRALDLTGQKFGELTALEKLRKKGNVYWRCRCSCGKEKELRQSHLLSGATTSCGCKSTVDLIGQRFGKLIVTKRGRKISNGSHPWICQCDCGNSIETQAGHLRNKETTSCGCSRVIDLTGKKFGRLTILSKIEGSFGRRGDKSYKWKCKCDCGNEITVTGGDLRSEHTQSCGCLFLDKVTKHGQAGSVLYRVWAGIFQRCTNSNSTGYKDYGGRGITVCEEWSDFEKFYVWAIKAGYKKGLQIDRIDNNGNYCPENCRWATPTENARNTRKNKMITYKGITKCLSAWAEDLGMKDACLRGRFARGMAITEALTRPVTPYKTKAA